MLSSFAAGIVAAQEAITAGIAEPRSNGRTAGQITKLALVKRQMCGRSQRHCFAPSFSASYKELPFHQK
jgi:transposase